MLYEETKDRIDYYVNWLNKIIDNYEEKNKKIDNLSDILIYYDFIDFFSKIKGDIRYNNKIGYSEYSEYMLNELEVHKKIFSLRKSKLLKINMINDK